MPGQLTGELLWDRRCLGLRRVWPQTLDGYQIKAIRGEVMMREGGQGNGHLVAPREQRMPYGDEGSQVGGVLGQRREEHVH